MALFIFCFVIPFDILQPMFFLFVFYQRERKKFDVCVKNAIYSKVKQVSKKKKQSDRTSPVAFSLP